MQQSSAVCGLTLSSSGSIPLILGPGTGGRRITISLKEVHIYIYIYIGIP